MIKKRLALITALLLCLLCTVSTAEALLSVGDKGKKVVEMKRRLQELRYITEKKVTNQYTEKTEETIRVFQRLNNLPETGTVDETTWEAIFSDTAVK